MQVAEEHAVSSDEQEDVRPSPLPQPQVDSTPQIGTVCQDMRTREGRKIIRKGYVYRLEGSDGYYYYGSTHRSLEERFLGHREASGITSHKQQPVTIHFTALGWDHVTMTSVLEMVSTRDELYKAEGEIVKQHLGSPQCLNRFHSGLLETSGQRFKRIYAERDGVRVTCECGDSLVQAAMPGHLTSQRHKNNINLRTLPQSAEERMFHETVVCECGRKVKSYGMAVHKLTQDHILKVALKRVPRQKPMGRPPPIPTPPGLDETVVYCQCPCGDYVKRSAFWNHTATNKHLKKMIAAGLLKVEGGPAPSTGNTASSLPKGKYLCRCGAAVAIQRQRFHQETHTHMSKVRELDEAQAAAGESKPIETAVLADDVLPPALPEGESIRYSALQACREAKKAPVLCECGVMSTSQGIKNHRKSISHLERLRRREEGIPSPVKKYTLMKNRIECVCGVSVTQGAMYAHKKSDRHRSYEESATEALLPSS